MKLEGIHHITAITADAPGNVEFYTGVLGLRMVKKTVNQDDPTVYHLFYGDEDGSPGADLTFFEYPGAARGKAGAGMVHRIVWRVSRRRHSSSGASGWARAGRRSSGPGSRSCSPIPRASSTSCWSRHARRAAGGERPGHPGEHALQGFDGVRAYSAEPDASSSLLGDDARLHRRR